MSMQFDANIKGVVGNIGGLASPLPLPGGCGPQGVAGIAGVNSGLSGASLLASAVRDDTSISLSANRVASCNFGRVNASDLLEEGLGGSSPVAASDVDAKGEVLGKVAENGMVSGSGATVSAETGTSSGLASKIISASAYADGSDVKNLAYALAGKRDRADADLSGYSVLRAGDGANKIRISKADDSGGVVINVDGQEQKFSRYELSKLIIDGGAGNDSISVDSDVVSNLNIVGGKGNDSISSGGGKDTIYDNYGANYINGGAGDDTIIANQLDVPTDNRNFVQKLFDYISGKSSGVDRTGNTIYGGAGDDYIEGGLGRDSISGGTGNDTIYGLDDDDYIDGGSGDDYIDGGAGADQLFGSSGNDIVSGGQGSDVIKSGAGQDVIIGGSGADSIYDTEGVNRVVVDGLDSGTVTTGSEVSLVRNNGVPSNVKVEGDKGYQARVGSDLETLSSIGVGQSLFEGLKGSGRSVTIKSTDSGNMCSFTNGAMLKSNGRANEGSDSTVEYNRSRVKLGSDDWGTRPPVVGMFHEMVHSFDASWGVMDGKSYDYSGNQVEDGKSGSVKGYELQAVGIDVGSVMQNPANISENGLRAFLGLANRDRY